MKNGSIYVSELSTSKHIFKKYHFCRGNSNKRKSRLGVIIKGKGTYIYLNKKLSVAEGDVVFIPENIFCYSEWQGSPDIEVTYLSAFMHYESLVYEPQVLQVSEEIKKDILEAARLLSLGESEELSAYSLFYKVLSSIVPKMKKSSEIPDKTLLAAIEYITENRSESFSVADLAKSLCVSESTVYHLFQTKLGQTPIRFLNSIRINIAIEYLENSHKSISTIAEEVGFKSENHFRKTFAEYTGTTPLKYRKSKQ